jgi:Flp pilus assembly protein TadD
MVNDTLGWILAQRGAHEEALEFLREALARRGGDSEIRYHLAVVLNALGRAAEAQRQLEQALEGGQDFASRAAAQALQSTLAASTP